MGSSRRIGLTEQVLLGCLVICFLLVWPVGSYAVDDDWAYTKSLEHLHERGRIEILDWNPMTLVGHLLWGRLFTALFGFGFTVAKLSTVVLVLVEGVAVAALLRRLGVSESVTLVATLSVVLNPLHLFQSFLYATDIPTLAWSMMAVLFYVRGLESAEDQGWRSLLLGSAFAALALGVRQPAVLIVVAVLTHCLLFDRSRLKRPRFLLAAFGMPVAAGMALLAWYHRVHGPTTAYEQAQQEILQYLQSLTPGILVQVAYFLLAYVAFFVLPLVVACVPTSYLPRGRLRIVAWPTWAGLVAVFAWLGFGQGRWFPYLRNKLTMFGFLSPNELIVGAREVLWGPAVGFVVSLILLLGACGFVAGWLRSPGEQRPRSQVLRLVGVLVALQLLYSAATIGIAFDRHLLILLPTCVVLFAGSVGSRARWRPALAGLVLLPFAFYGVAGTHDVHAFSRAAERMGSELLNAGVDPRFIDAGYAFDGWHMYERSVAELRLPGSRSLAEADAWYLHSVIPRIRPRYLVSLSPSMDVETWAEAVSPWAVGYAFMPSIEQYRVRKQESYLGFWPAGRRPIYLLENPHR